MIALICSTTFALAFSLVPNGSAGPREQFRDLPPPAEVHQEITDRLLTNYQKMLAAATKARKQLEKQLVETSDPQLREWRSALVVRVKESEANLQRRVDSLERGRLTPVMPLVPAERAKPKLPIRD